MCFKALPVLSRRQTDVPARCHTPLRDTGRVTPNFRERIPDAHGQLVSAELRIPASQGQRPHALAVTRHASRKQMGPEVAPRPLRKR